MKKLLIYFSLLLSPLIWSQSNNFDSDALLFVKSDSRSQKFIPFIKARFASEESFQKFTQENKYEFLKQLWYYSQSFYIKRNHQTDGFTMDESMIDITRFHSSRMEDVEVILTFEGFKDAIVLLPRKKLTFKND